MSANRRMLTVVGLTGAVTAAASGPAWAAYGDSARISTTTATTVEKRTVRTDPIPGVQTQTAYSSTTTYATSTSNVQSYTTSSAAGPGLYETTTTTTTKNTDLSVTASWAA